MQEPQPGAVYMGIQHGSYINECNFKNIPLKRKIYSDGLIKQNQLYAVFKKLDI